MTTKDPNLIYCRCGKAFLVGGILGDAQSRLSEHKVKECRR